MSTLFKASKFTATKFHSAEDKAKLAGALAKFVEEGCNPNKFKKAVYERLMHMFGHIAHYNHGGFSSAWFETPAKRLQWVKHVLAYEPVGDPKFCWSDVEREIILWLKRECIVNRFLEAHEKEVEKIERAELTRLSAKYGRT